MYILEKELKFSSAHHLENKPGLITKKCLNIHGHCWKVLVKVQIHGIEDDMVIDFSALKNIVDELDHKDLNEVLSFNPTAENIAKYLYDQIVDLFEEDRLPIVEVTVEESSGAKITYRL